MWQLHSWGTFFFFFHWHYSPLWTLACQTVSFHFSLNIFWALICPSSGARDCTCELHNFPHPGHIACCSAPNSRPPATKALHTICGNNTGIVSSSWRLARKCLKHVEQIISAIKHSVASSWFLSLCLYNNAQTPYAYTAMPRQKHTSNVIAELTVFIFC